MPPQTMDYESLSKDPDFLALDRSVQREVLSEVDTDFRGLTPDVQVEVLGKMSSGPVFDSVVVDPPSFGEQFKHGVKEAVVGKEAGLTGAAAGGMIGFGLGGPPGAIIGAGLGGMVGKTIEREVAPRPEQTPLGAVQELGLSGAQGLLMEAGGQGLGKVIGKVAAPFKSKVTQVGREAMDVLNGKVLPSQATESRMLDIGENVAGASVLSGGKIKDFKLQQQQIMDDLVDGLVEKIGKAKSPMAVGERIQREVSDQVVAAEKGVARKLKAEIGRLTNSIKKARRVGTKEAQATAERLSHRVSVLETRLGKEMAPLQQFGAPQAKEDVGQLLKDAVEGNTKKIIAWKDKLYSEAKALIPEDTVVERTSLNKWAERELANFADPAIAKSNKETVQFLEDIAGADDVMSFAEADNLRSGLGEIGRDISKSNRLRGVAKQLQGALSDEMNEVAEAISPEAQKAWRLAHDFYRLTLARESGEHAAGIISKFRNDLIVKATRSEPDKVLDLFLKPNKLSEMQKIRRVVGDETWQSVQARFVDNLRGAASPKGTFLPEAFEKELGKYSSSELKVIFPKGEDVSLRRMAQFLKETGATREAYTEATQTAAKDVTALETRLAKEQKLGTTALERRYKGIPQDSALAQLNKGLSSKDPGNLISKYFGPGQASKIQNLWKVLSEETKTDTRRIIMETVIGRADGGLNGTAILRRLTRMGDDTAKIIFPRGEHTQVRRFARVLEELQKKQGEGTGAMYIQLAQPGAAVGMLGYIFGGAKGAIPGVITGVLAVPPVIAAIFTSPAALKWLTVGLEANPGGRVAAEATAKLTTWLTMNALMPQVEPGSPEASAEELPQQTIGPREDVEERFIAPPPGTIERNF